MDCERHGLRKNFIFCLENGCQDRLVCKKCYLVDELHYQHRRINVDYFMENDYDELTRLFDQMYIENHQNGKQFLEALDGKIEKMLDEREEMIRQPFEEMVGQYRLQFYEMKQQLYQKYDMSRLDSIDQIQQNIRQLLDHDSSHAKQKGVKEQIDSVQNLINVQTQMDLIVKQIQQNDRRMVDQMQQITNRFREQQVEIFESYIDSMEQIEQLQQCEKQVEIDGSNTIEHYEQEIQQYQQQNMKYRIEINFYDVNNGIECKTRIIDMINRLGVNHKVATLMLDLNRDNVINSELLAQMVDRYPNLYGIWVHDRLEQVDVNVHDQIQTIVQTSKLTNFGLVFYDELFDNSDNVPILIKEYNQIIKQKKWLKQLWYKHSMINDNKYEPEEIQKMINDVVNM